MGIEHVKFLLDEPDEVMAGLPTTIAEYWHWQASASQLTPYWGRYHWVLQTYLYLREAGLSVGLCNRMPDQGVVITHLDCVDYGLRPPPGVLLCVLLVDREVPHPRAALHVVHNPAQRLPLGLRQRFMPPWPQIGILPRDTARGQRFEAVGYFGYPHNLDPSLSNAGFQAELKALGLHLVVPEPSAWHDFRQVDAVLALRNLGTDNPHMTKPALKLFNAWLAGVPAVLGFEAAYREAGKPGIDYMEATTPEAVLLSLRQLRDDPALRSSMVSAGSSAVAAYSAESTVQRWKSLLHDVLLPAWQSRPTGLMPLLDGMVMAPLRERLLWRRPNWFGTYPYR
jgi:hypothetical protein